jgi:hypothetical protein
MSYMQMLPAEAVQQSIYEVLRLLEQQYGADLYKAIEPDQTIISDKAQLANGQWLRTTNCVGINVRTLGSFWKIIPYAMTLPRAQDSIHILPIWEPGVVASLYGMASWQINPEFFSTELAGALPNLDTVEKQLKVVVNILHLMGKTVGMDVVPHTDRYAEQVLANPRLFEWLQRDDLIIVRHESDLWRDAERLIFEALTQLGSATPHLRVPEEAGFFYVEMSETDRLLILFGSPQEYGQRLERRKYFVQWLYEHGFETVPATMGPPYRGLEVNPSPDACTIDEAGRVWRDYRITQPRVFSRAFGPLARYRLYESHDNNADWQLDFARPVQDSWEYVCRHYADIQATYGFDFMRGDMSHVQMRPDGVPKQPDAYYDLLGAVKRAIAARVPSFGYFAESFLAPPNDMAYGDECDHLEASLADSTLGDLQSEPIFTKKFMRDFTQYRHWLDTRQFAPNFTIMTADKDDPRFDSFYLEGNEVRHFMALFLTDMPSYMGLGFECRDPHPTPAPNEHYTKLYVFHETNGPKSTHGPYVWGQNQRLYKEIVAQKMFSEAIYDQIKYQKIEWIVSPDPTGHTQLIVWRVASYVFAANLSRDAVQYSVGSTTKTRLVTPEQPLRQGEIPGLSCIAWELVAE